MTAIQYLKGDATSPQAKGTKIIAHICNDIGGWAKALCWQFPEDGKHLKKNTGTGTVSEVKIILLWAKFRLCR